jgi:site-specific DNA recombinase
LADFAKMVEIFDAHQVSFVSITQQFSTTTSMGRLTLNVLLSFAQFEREVTGERIRDKIAASKKKGMWMGGYCPLGYDVRDRQLVAVPEESQLVRHIYARYLELKSVRLLKQDLDRRGMVSKVRMSKNGVRSGGMSFSRGALYQLLANPIYLGEIRHKKLRHPGQHPAVIDRAVWEEVQKHLRARAAREGISTKPATNFLAGKLFDENGEPLRVTGAIGRHGGHYRYYVSRDLVTAGRSVVDTEKSWRLAAPELEKTVIVSVQAILNDQAAIATTVQEAGASTAEIHTFLTAAARTNMQQQGSPASPSLTDLVERVDLRRDGLEMTINLRLLLPSESVIASAPYLTFSRFVPVRMQRRGVAMRLLIGGAVSTRKIDPTLLRAIARGRKWFQELVSGKTVFAREIAAREGVNERYVRRLIPLAFLSPQIVEAIAEGSQPISLTGEALSRGIDIPAEWNRQNAALGFDA